MANTKTLEKLETKIDSLEAAVHDLDKNLAIYSDKFDTHKTDSENQMGSIQSTLNRVDLTLAENTRQLEIHIAGVREAQRNNDLLREELSVYKKDTEHRISKVEAPIKFLSMIKTVGIWIASVAAAIGVIKALF